MFDNKNSQRKHKQNLQNEVETSTLISVKSLITLFLNLEQKHRCKVEKSSFSFSFHTNAFLNTFWTFLNIFWSWVDWSCHNTRFLNFNTILVLKNTQYLFWYPCKILLPSLGNNLQRVPKLISNNVFGWKSIQCTTSELNFVSLVRLKVWDATHPLVHPRRLRAKVREVDGRVRKRHHTWTMNTRYTS